MWRERGIQVQKGWCLKPSSLVKRVLFSYSYDIFTKPSDVIFVKASSRQAFQAKRNSFVPEAKKRVFRNEVPEPVVVSSC